mmetsp:Transcript_17722/g.44290  ORF Transcript_17722/g.44290 Transcript_17722/m.44290 type:complete len:552 (-) Transcript_17722:308-1963(-)
MASILNSMHGDDPTPDSSEDSPRRPRPRFVVAWWRQAQRQYRSSLPRGRPADERSRAASKMLRLAALVLIISSSSSHMHHAYQVGAGGGRETRDDGLPADRGGAGATVEQDATTSTNEPLARHPNKKSFLRLRHDDEGRSLSATGVSRNAPMKFDITPAIHLQSQRDDHHDPEVAGDRFRGRGVPDFPGGDAEVAVATSSKSSAVTTPASPTSSLLAMTSKPSGYKDYDLGKTDCGYWIDIQDGDYYLGDICQISLSMDFYREGVDKKWPAKQAVADITSVMKWAFSKDRFPQPPEGINQELLNAGAKECMPAFDFAQRMREALFWDKDQSSPFAAYYTDDHYPLSDDVKEQKLKHLGVDSVAELEKLIKADFRGQQLTSADPGAGDPVDGERRDYDIRKDFMWMCHVICDLLDGKQGSELLTCATYTYVELDAVDEHGNKHKWPAGGCWPKFKQVQKRDKVSKKSRMASVCIERACGVKIRDDGTYKEDAEDKESCLKKYPMNDQKIPHYHHQYDDVEDHHHLHDDASEAPARLRGCGQEFLPQLREDVD